MPNSVSTQTHLALAQEIANRYAGLPQVMAVAVAGSVGAGATICSITRRVTSGANSVPVSGRPDGVDELVGLAVLQQEPARAGAQPGEHVVVAIERREDDDPRRPGAARDDAPGRLDPVHARHLHVHEHDVWPGARDHLERLLAVGGLPDDLDVVLDREHQLETRAHEPLVVDEHDP